MTEQDFDYIRKFLQDRSAIVLEADKRYLVESRLTPLARRLNMHSIGELVGQLLPRVLAARPPDDMAPGLGEG